MPPEPTVPEILLTRRGEERLTAFLARAGTVGGRPSSLQVRVLVDQLVDQGEGWAPRPGSAWRLRALSRAAGAEVLPAAPAPGGMRRIPHARVAALLAATDGGRGAAIGTLARVAGVAGEWDGLLDFLRGADRAGGELTVVADPLALSPGTAGDTPP
ncbi:MAG TPA: hypothetical protein VNT51_00885 [Miltoncostaeaceae bacterium]|nr:hypothetical protein [Miltoncostaeaceae bacterium]